MEILDLSPTPDRFNMRGTWVFFLYSFFLSLVSEHLQQILSNCDKHNGGSAYVDEEALSVLCGFR